MNDCEGRSHLVGQDEGVDDVDDLLVSTWQVSSDLTDQPLLTWRRNRIQSLIQTFEAR